MRARRPVRCAALMSSSPPPSADRPAPLPARPELPEGVWRPEPPRGRTGRDELPRWPLWAPFAVALGALFVLAGVAYRADRRGSRASSIDEADDAPGPLLGGDARAGPAADRRRGALVRLATRRRRSRTRSGCAGRASAPASAGRPPCSARSGSPTACSWRSSAIRPSRRLTEEIKSEAAFLALAGYIAAHLRARADRRGAVLPRPPASPCCARALGLAWGVVVDGRAVLARARRRVAHRGADRPARGLRLRPLPPVRWHRIAAPVHRVARAQQLDLVRVSQRTWLGRWRCSTVAGKRGADGGDRCSPFARRSGDAGGGGVEAGPRRSPPRWRCSRRPRPPRRIRRPSLRPRLLAAAPKITMVAKNVLRAGGEKIVLRRRSFRLRGTMTPAVAGQRVELSVHRNGKRNRTVRAGVRADGTFTRRMPTQAHRAGSASALRTPRRPSSPPRGARSCPSASSSRARPPARAGRSCGCCSAAWPSCATRCRATARSTPRPAAP